MKKVGLFALAAIGLLGVAQAAPISYGGRYYEIVNFSVETTWDQAKAQEDALSYSGLGAQLATITSQAENNDAKGLINFTAGSIAEIGVLDSGSDYSGYTFGAETLASTATGKMTAGYDVVPEPTGLALLAMGCAAVAMRRRVSKKA